MLPMMKLTLAKHVQCALEYAKEDGNNAVAEQATNVGVNRHLDEQICKLNTWKYKYKFKYNNKYKYLQPI